MGVKMSENPTFWEYLIGGVIALLFIVALGYEMSGRDPFEFFTDIKKMFKKRRSNGK